MTTVSLAKVFSSRPPVRRYMDFTKFISILENQSLFFPTAEILPDLAEGMPYSQMELMMMKALETVIEKNGGDIEKGGAKAAAQSNEMQAWRKKFVAISSWYASDHESYAMWKLYASEGVCINSTELKLGSSLKRGDIIIRNVEYGKRPKFDPEYLGAFFKKLPAYKYENEIRIVINLYEKYGHNQTHWSDPEFKSLTGQNGLFVPVNVRELINSVTVSPLAKAWFKKLVRDVLKRYELEVQILESELDGQVLY